MVEPDLDPIDPRSKGRRNFIHSLDAWADRHPHKPHAVLLNGPDVSQGFRTVTIRQVRDASDAFAWWLTENIGPSDGSFPTVCYVGLTDLRYAVVLFGCIKAGYKALFVSPRNPAEQNASLLQQTQCKLFLHSTELTSHVKAVTDLMPWSVRSQTLPVFEEWLAQDRRPFAYNKTFEESKYDEIFVLHSSGSTGAPKPIVIKHGWQAANDGLVRQIPGRDMAGFKNFELEGNGELLATFPPYHLAGLHCMVLHPVAAFECTVIYTLPDRPPSPQLAFDILLARRPRVLYSPPSIIEAISQIPGGLDALCSTESIVYAGGPLSKACGDLITRRVKLSCIYGSTETGSSMLMYPGPDDWDYLEWHPDVCKRMEPAVDGAYELVWSQEDPHPETRPVTFTMPKSVEFRTHDMFMPHPTKPNLWKFYGRNDDIIVFSNGSKYNPVPAENILLSNSNVSGAVISGDGYALASLLVEPRGAPASADAFIDSIMPEVEQANSKSQRQGRILRSMISVIEPGGLIRAPKGTIVRSHTRQKYKDQIERLYSVDSKAVQGPEFVLQSSLQASMLTFLHQCAQQLNNFQIRGDDDDFYVHGLDSVQTAEFCRYLRQGLKAKYGDLPWLTAPIVFRYPTFNSLSETMVRRVSMTNGAANGTVNGTSESKSAAMDNMVDIYTSRIRELLKAKPTNEKTPSKSSGLHVAITGSTGSLGMRIVQSLAADTNIKKITCLDRSENAKARIQAAIPGIDLSKARFLQSSFGHEKIGLSDSDYEELRSSVDVVFLNAWKVNFNQSLESFESVHIQGVYQFVKLSIASDCGARLIFVSSLATMQQWSAVRGNSDIPETVVPDSRLASSMGYGQSKQVSERILANIADQVPVTILRVGQIAGPVGTKAPGPAWNMDEWLPLLITTSRELGYLPDSLLPITWVPVDLLAAIIKDLMFHDLSTPPEKEAYHLYNLLNPRISSWSDLVPVVQNRLTKPNRRCEPIPPYEWVEKLQQLNAADPANLEKYPALKILPFFANTWGKKPSSSAHKNAAPVWTTRNGVAASKTMADLQPVGKEWMALWLDQWKM